MRTSEFIIAFVTAFGGLEAVKWLVQVCIHRKTDARKRENDVSEQEREAHRRHVDWLENKFQQYHETIERLYAELYEEQLDKETWIKRFHELELTLKEAEIRKCDKRGCPNRKPPTDF